MLIKPVSKYGLGNSPLRHRVSKIFQPVFTIPKELETKRCDKSSKSQRLMTELGLIKQSSPGCYHLLPLAVKAFEKLKSLIDYEMNKIGGQKMIFPTLIKDNLWKRSGRLNEASTELFKLKDRHQQNYLLGPTHEEVASELLSTSSPPSYKQFPIKLYQMTSKFRDEMKPRFGLIRGKQFDMKDMYSFDVDLESATETYQTICDSYNVVFEKIGVDFIKVLGSTGIMGGNLSHEYHYRADVGDDIVLTCNNCNYAANMELLEEEICPKCKRSDSVQLSSAIEVGHTFLLGDKYTRAFQTTYLSKSRQNVHLVMGSYGLGLSRILAASLEVLSKEEELRWPDAIVPYNVLLIPPKSGSKEEPFADKLLENLYTSLNKIPHLKDNILLDDRDHLTIGRRFLEGKRFGYPQIIVLGDKITEDTPLYELHDLKIDGRLYLREDELVHYIDKFYNNVNR